LEQAADAYPGVVFEDLSNEVLVSIQKERGIDFAAAVFFDRAKRARPEARTFAPGNAREVLVVPSALYRHYPEFSGDGEIFRAIAASHGLPARLAPVVSVGSTRENAAIIRTLLVGKAPRSVLVVTMSKGAADFRAALELYPELIEKVAGWVSASGILHGTYTANRMLEARGLKRLLIGLNLWLHGGGWDFARSIEAGVPGARRLEARDFPFPIASVLGCPMKHHLTPYTRARHAYVARYGPNDGCALLADAFVAGSQIFPVWGGDHFLFVPESSFILREAFAYALGRPHLPEGLGRGTQRLEANPV
jgi:uncharacterized SAM-binding protein YcdF (DUF218 family)